MPELGRGGDRPNNLAAMVVDAQPTPEELDELLREARTVGDEWVAAGEAR